MGEWACCVACERWDDETRRDLGRDATAVSQASASAREQFEPTSILTPPHYCVTTEIQLSHDVGFTSEGLLCTLNLGRTEILHLEGYLARYMMHSSQSGWEKSPAHPNNLQLMYMYTFFLAWMEITNDPISKINLLTPKTVY